MFSGLPITHRIAGFALLATVIVLVILAHDLRGDIDENVSVPLRNSPSYITEQLGPTPQSSGNQDPMLGPAEKNDKDASYYVFLQKFPLENSWKMIFHTEVIVCPRETFATDTEFLGLLDGLVQNTLSPSRFVERGVGDDDTTKLPFVYDDTTKLPFAAIEKEQWMKQSVAGCVQLGYGGANCGSPCCGSPHKQENRNYALNSHQAVIGNAMGDYKELYFYGMSGTSTPNGSEADGVSGISGDDAYKAVCHGHMNAVEMGSQPVCVSNWGGRDYNPLTNNCNTFTSTVLKCVYGFSDAKPHLGVSDMRTVTCPTETTLAGKQVQQCLIPTFEDSSDMDEVSMVQ